MAWPGASRPGETWRIWAARLGAAGCGMARRGGCGVAWWGKAGLGGCGIAWWGKAGHGKVCRGGRGMSRTGKAWGGLARPGAADMDERQGAVWPAADRRGG